MANHDMNSANTSTTAERAGQAKAQRAVLASWNITTILAVIVCWVLGSKDCGRANSSAEGWGGAFAVVSTLPALAAVGLGVRFYRNPNRRSWLRFACVILALLLASATGGAEGK
jgi:hypothetical protein